MFDKCAPVTFLPTPRENLTALFFLISIFPPSRHIASHRMLSRENVPHKLDCMLPCCSTSSAPLWSPLPLTGRPLCPASVLTSLQFFRWWRFRAPWRLLLTAKCGETGARLSLLVQQQLTNFTGRRRSEPALRRLTSSDLSLLENGQEASIGCHQQRHLAPPPEHVLAGGPCKSTRRPTLKPEPKQGRSGIRWAAVSGEQVARAALVWGNRWSPGSHMWDPATTAHQLESPSAANQPKPDQRVTDGGHWWCRAERRARQEGFVERQSPVLVDLLCFNLFPGHRSVFLCNKETIYILAPK